MYGWQPATLTQQAMKYELNTYVAYLGDIDGESRNR